MMKDIRRLKGEIEGFDVHGHTIYFKIPLIVEASEGEVLGESKIHIFSVTNCKFLDLWEPATTIDEGISGLKHQLAMVWSDYVEEHEGLLTEDALQFKQDFLGLIVEEEKEGKGIPPTRKNMIFDVLGHIGKILDRTKTRTTRVSRGRYQKGQCYKIQPCRTCKGIPDVCIMIDEIYQELPLKWRKYIERGDVKPESIKYPIKYIPISEEDAKAEGGYTPEEFEELFKQINPKWPEDERWAFEFHLVQMQKEG